MSNQSINTVLSSNIISVSPGTPLSEAVSIMENNKISCLVVLKEKQPVGIFTERDLVFLASRGDCFSNIEIKEVMSKSVISASIDIDIFEAYRLLEINKIRHLIIVDRNGEIAGVVTHTDIINNLGLEYFIELKSISKIMTKNIVTLDKGRPVRNAISLMAGHSISCVIVEDKGRPAGILTERDVVRLFRMGADMETLQTDTAMSHPVITIPEEASVHEAAISMNRKKIRRLVVTDKEGRISGLITQHDIIKKFELKYIEFLKEIIREKEKILQETEKAMSDKIVLDNILRYSTDMAIIATDLDFKIGYYNPAAENIFGYKAEEVIGKNVREMHTKENVDPSRFEKALETIILKGKYKCTFEIGEKEADRLIDCTISGIQDKAHNLIGFVLMAQDITKNLRAEEEIRRNYDIQTVLNRLLGLSLENVSLEEILRRTLDLILSIPWLAFESRGGIFLADDDSKTLVLAVQTDLPEDLLRSCAQIEFGRCLCGRAALKKEIEFADCIDNRHEIGYEGIKPHGHYCVPIIFTGKLLGIINIYVKEGHQRDQKEDAFLTAIANTLAGVIVRKQMEENMIKTNAQFETLIQAIPDAVFFKDSRGRHLVINKACEELMGLTNTEKTDKNHGQNLPSHMHEKCRESDEIVLSSLKPIHLEEQFTGKDGEKIILDTIKVPLYDNQGNAVGLVGVSRDITERKKMEEELLKARKLESIGILAGGIAHDFNNLLTAILGNISIAKEYTDTEKELFKILDNAEEASIRASDLTKLLITFSKGGGPIKKAIQIGKMLRKEALHVLSGSNILCTFNIPEDLWPVKTDEGQLKWVIHNMVLNAREAMPGGGTIDISAENITISAKTDIPLKEGNYIRIAIEDHGVGIPDENLLKIFDPYFTTKEMATQKGMGLGLSICYSIIKGHNGLITVKSEVNAGTIFHIYLPVSV